MSDKPLCLLCGASDRVEFNMFPKTWGYKFGEICVPCDEKMTTIREVIEWVVEVVDDVDDVDDLVSEATDKIYAAIRRLRTGEE